MRHVNNPPNPWLSHSVEWIGEPPAAKIEVFEETETRSIISRNDSLTWPLDNRLISFRAASQGGLNCSGGRRTGILASAPVPTFERKMVVTIAPPGVWR